MASFDNRFTSQVDFKPHYLWINCQWLYNISTTGVKTFIQPIKSKYRYNKITYFTNY
jgi:hypothetical protein